MGTKEAVQGLDSPGDGRPTLIAVAHSPEDVPAPEEVAAVIATNSEAAVGGCSTDVTCIHEVFPSMASPNLMWFEVDPRPISIDGALVPSSLNMALGPVLDPRPVNGVPPALGCNP